jgi:hypothetical protein
MCIPLSSLKKGLVNVFPRQEGIVGGVVSCVVCIILKESRYFFLEILVVFTLLPVCAEFLQVSTRSYL